MEQKHSALFSFENVIPPNIEKLDYNQKDKLRMTKASRGGGSWRERASVKKEKLSYEVRSSPRWRTRLKTCCDGCTEKSVSTPLKRSSQHLPAGSRAKHGEPSGETSTVPCTDRGRSKKERGGPARLGERDLEGPRQFPAFRARHLSEFVRQGPDVWNRRIQNSQMGISWQNPPASPTKGGGGYCPDFGDKKRYFENAIEFSPHSEM